MSSVSLVGMTTPSASTGCSTAEDLIAYAARVSNPDNQNHPESAPRLLRYLIKHGHWSPFEMVNVTMEIRTTRDIARQMLRHRSFSFQEFSQRYAIAEDFHYREARLQDPANRQNSIELEGTEDFGKGGNKTYQERLYEDWNMKQAKVLDASKKRISGLLIMVLQKSKLVLFYPKAIPCLQFIWQETFAHGFIIANCGGVMALRKST